ncbi:RNA polymerase sigma-70 factor (sigma-E family) [Motilibacter peucedani]|uniref:RNA polymerase sigma-70 factor (Sigma-E family) n=1 Tax=Motilibacter peucedani TaxID=598650 RepID=A0A420XLE1_9ACTN|nr:SigE family RNA polymerase sigma factor [Motilibacter peucedani]RKS69363.1 RNA polymerase sigma-70 factor (sigma-E family) [Motilibacter peucedani]
MTPRPDPDFARWAATARPRLRRTAFLLSGDWHLAEDLAQDALLRVYAVWHRASASGAPDAYARATLVNAFRAGARRPWRRERVVALVPERHDAAAADATAGLEERDALLVALARLGPSQRAVVVLRYWEDMSVASVADALGLSEGTVKSQAARGLDSLRRTLRTPSYEETR